MSGWTLLPAQVGLHLCVFMGGNEHFFPLKTPTEKRSREEREALTKLCSQVVLKKRKKEPLS